MTPYTLRAAISAAEEFLKRAKDARSTIVKEKWGEGWVGNKETAAAKRASMDLTRALADMRRSS